MLLRAPPETFGRGPSPGLEASMKWVTRENAVVDRIACPWLIRKFVDPEAEFLFVPAARVAEVAKSAPAIPYDVEGVELGHVDGRCSFESILLKYGLSQDPALAAMARVVHGADVAADIDIVPEARGLRALAQGFRLQWGADDARKLELEFPMYDALHAWARQQAASTTP
jgi:hypothetical protein